MTTQTIEKIALTGAKLVVVLTLAAIALTASGLFASSKTPAKSNAERIEMAPPSAETGALTGTDGAENTPPAAQEPQFLNASNYVIKRILDIDEPLQHGDYAWDDKGVPDGQLLITVDLKAQTLSVFRGGYEIGVAVILFGGNGKPTPTGTFPITEKDADHISNLYHVPMPYMMRLTNDGIAVHGSEVEWGYATHGCVGVPTEFAKLLFDQVKLGDIVIITDGQMMQLGDAVTGV